MNKINLPVVTNNFKISSNPKVIEIGSDIYAKFTMDPFINNKEHKNKIWFINNIEWSNIQFYDNLESVKSKNYNEFKSLLKDMELIGQYLKIVFIFQLQRKEIK